MVKKITIIIIIAFCSIDPRLAQDFEGPDTVSVHSSNLILKALLWRPVGKGPFATVIFCLGSYTSADTIHDPIKEASVLGPLFARRGYVYLALFRRGVSISKGQGLNSADLMENAFGITGRKGATKSSCNNSRQPNCRICSLDYFTSEKDRM